VYSPDEKAKIIQAILVTVQESYSQCPRALAFSKLWQADTIQSNTAKSPIKDWVAGT
jgi:predicted pyridoxine 5'-phosphate oxidase superfamily flavin-nucleotide-binding protein